MKLWDSTPPDEEERLIAAGLLNGAVRSAMIATLVLAVITLGYLAVRWGAVEYYITTHCTYIMGTRVCQ